MKYARLEFNLCKGLCYEKSVFHHYFTYNVKIFSKITLQPPHKKNIFGGPGLMRDSAKPILKFLNFDGLPFQRMTD